MTTFMIALDRLVEAIYTIHLQSKNASCFKGMCYRIFHLINIPKYAG